jgi:hypothetical protein
MADWFAAGADMQMSSAKTDHPPVLRPEGETGGSAPQQPIWQCNCEKCGNTVEVSDSDLNRAIPWPCAKCGESSVYLRKKPISHHQPDYTKDHA